MEQVHQSSNGIAQLSDDENIVAVANGSADRYSARIRSGKAGFTTGVRESMAVLPSWLQPLLTHVTGKPLPHEKPSLAPAPLLNFSLSLLALVAIAGANLCAFSQSALLGFLLLAPQWVLVTGLLRKFQVVFGHHATHRMFFKKSEGANQFMLNILTTLPLAQNGLDYQRDHFAHHNRNVFTTLDDPDAALLHEFGIAPGKTRPALWRALWMTLLSPRFHAVLLGARLRSNVTGRPIVWRLAALAWVAFLTVGLCQFQPWWQVALVVWVPILFLYNISALLQFSTEHAWMVSQKGPKELDAYADRCWGRFLGSACPPPEKRGIEALLLWTKWWAAMAVIHAPVRFGVLVGDLPAHDWHHLCGFLKHKPNAWPVAIFARQSAIDSGLSLGMESRELWGLYNMLNEIFSTLETAMEHRPQQDLSENEAWPTTTTK